MSTTQALQKKEPLYVTTARELNVPESRLQLIKDTFAKGATDDELSLFLVTAHRTGLDPVARQLFVVKRYDSNLQKSVMAIQISIDGFRLIADRTERYVPGKEATYTYDADGNLESATAYVKKLVAGSWHEISATAFYSEYVQTTREKKPNSMWAKMPRLMLAKCAESLALRKAFPAELSGLYTADEMGTTSAAVAAAAPEHAANSPASVIPFNNQTKTQDEGGSAPTTPPSAEEKMHALLNQQLGEVCGDLNKAKDSIKWTGHQLTEYANGILSAEVAHFMHLDLPKKEALVADLRQRLADLETTPDENAGAIIDAEFVAEVVEEVAPPPVFETFRAQAGAAAPQPPDGDDDIPF